MAIARAREILMRPVGTGGGDRLRAAMAREAEYREQRGCVVIGCDVRPLGGPRDRNDMCARCADEVEALERDERERRGDGSVDCMDHHRQNR